MVKQDTVIIEENVPFSKSRLWEAQRAYYDVQGIDAWIEEVPFYVTSNPVIANSYADIIIRFIQDIINKQPEARKEPFYIVEIGSGPGQFSFYTLKRMQALQKTLNLDVSIRYVMTDFTEKNLEFWQKHPALMPFIEAGMLDFARFDIEHDSDIHLLQSGQVLTPGSLSNPIAMIANYLFDSVVADVFRVHDGELHASLVNLSTQKKNVVGDSPVDWEQVDITYTDQTINSGYYEDHNIDQVLLNYRNVLQDTYFHFPVGAMAGIKRMMALSNQKMLLLSSDKGYVSENELEDLAYPELAFHGSFSLMVNYHAIAEYFKQLGGDAYLQQPFDGFATGVFVVGLSLDDMPKTQVVVRQQVNGFCPGHYFCMYEHMEKTCQTAELPALASFLTLSCWDPGIFDMFSERISEIADDSDQDVVDYLSSNLAQVAANFYFVPGSNDVLFDIGVYFHELELYVDAIKYFKQSIQFFPDNYEVFFNLGYCHYELNEFDVARGYFERALLCDPGSHETKEWLRKSNKQLALL